MKNHFLLKLYKNNGDFKYSVKVETIQQVNEIWNEEKVKPTVYYVETIKTRLKGY